MVMYLILWCDGLKCRDADDTASVESSSKKRTLQATKEEEVQQLVKEARLNVYNSAISNMGRNKWRITFRF